MEESWKLPTYINLLDENQVIWKGKEQYENLEAALEDAEQGIDKWMKENY